MDATDAIPANISSVTRRSSNVSLSLHATNAADATDAAVLRGCIEKDFPKMLKKNVFLLDFFEDAFDAHRVSAIAKISKLLHKRTMKNVCVS
jgi:hypothetical protein